MKRVVLFCFAILSISMAQAQYINEFHYDNTGADVGEFVEVFIPNPQPDLSTYTITLYNGAGGASYGSTALNGSAVVQTCVTMDGGCYYVWFYEGIQNGSPDGIALSGPSGLIQFLSYEGTFTATNGPANGVLSTDVGVAQGSSTPIGTSISLSLSSGWEEGIIATPGAANQNALPISLRSFTTTPMSANTIELAWVTESEENNSHFIIEHSMDGRNFEALDHMAGAGNSFEAQYYHFMHKGASRGQHYYRLKQVDFDGAFSYSPIRTVSLKDGKNISLYPSLAQDELHLVLPEGNLESSRVQIININGQTVVEQDIEAGVDQQHLDVSQLHAGYYLLRLTADGYEESLRFVKQ